MVVPQPPAPIFLTSPPILFAYHEVSVSIEPSIVLVFYILEMKSYLPLPVGSHLGSSHHSADLFPPSHMWED